TVQQNMSLGRYGGPRMPHHDYVAHAIAVVAATDAFSLSPIAPALSLPRYGLGLLARQKEQFKCSQVLGALPSACSHRAARCPRAFPIPATFFGVATMLPVRGATHR